MRLLLFSIGCIYLLFGCQPPTPVELLSINEVPDTVALFGEGLISTDLYERDLAISSDGQRLVYTLGDHKQNFRCLVTVDLTGNGWSEPRILPFSGQYQDIEPFFSPQGDKLFFASNRPVSDTSQRTDYNLWYVAIDSTHWGQPVALDTSINTPGQEYYPSVSNNGNLYFTATRLDGVGREDIFVSRWGEGGYQPPVVLDTVINRDTYEFNAYISPDENLLVFSSFGRADDLGGGDLYYSRRDTAGNWQTAVHLPEGINSDKLDYCPFVDERTGTFYFTSERVRPRDVAISKVHDLRYLSRQPGNGLGDIYRIRATRALNFPK